MTNTPTEMLADANLEDGAFVPADLGEDTSAEPTAGEPRKTLSTAERQKQMEDAVARAMVLYKREGDAVRANTARLKALREAHEAAQVAVTSKKGRKPAKAAAS